MSSPSDRAKRAVVLSHHGCGCAFLERDDGEFIAEIAENDATDWIVLEGIVRLANEMAAQRRDQRAAS